MAAPAGTTGVIYVVEQGGLVKVVKAGKTQPEPFLDIRSLVRSGGEQGLLSLAFHPRYRQNHLFYVDYTDRNGDTNVDEYTMRGAVAGRPAVGTSGQPNRE